MSPVNMQCVFKIFKIQTYCG